MPEDEENGPRYKHTSYADYSKLTAKMADRVEDVVDAHALVHAHAAPAPQMPGEQAVEAKKRFIGLGTRLKPEIRKNQGVEPFDEILERMDLEKVREMDLVTEHPDFLDQYVDDLVTAAFELGYTRVGQTKPADPDDETVQLREAMQ